MSANKTQYCEWADDGEGNWDTDCGEKHILLNDGPADNGMRFCCYCGKRLVQVEASDV